MRKAAGVLLAASMVLPLGLPVGLMASPAGAAGGTTCKTVTGTASVSPALPKLGSTKKVVASVTASGVKVAGCSGVKSATAGLAVKFSKAANCTTLSKGATNPAKGKMSFTWNTGQTSMVGAVTLANVAGKPTSWRVSGKVSAGLFKGSAVSGTLIYAPAGGGCVSVALSKITFKQFTALAIK